MFKDLVAKQHPTSIETMVILYPIVAFDYCFLIKIKDIQCKL